LDERQDDFANGNRIFAGLDVHISHAGGAMVNKQFGDLLVISAKAIEGAVAAAHTAIGAIFAAIVGDFDDAANKNLVSELRPGDQRSFSMKCLLILAGQIQHVGGRHTRLNHCRKIEFGGGECK